MAAWDGALLVSGFRNGILEADYDLRDAICQRLQQTIAMSDTALGFHTIAPRLFSGARSPPAH